MRLSSSTWRTQTPFHFLNASLDVRALEELIDSKKSRHSPLDGKVMPLRDINLAKLDFNYPISPTSQRSSHNPLKLRNEQIQGVEAVLLPWPHASAQPVQPDCVGPVAESAAATLKARFKGRSREAYVQNSP